MHGSKGTELDKKYLENSQMRCCRRTEKIRMIVWEMKKCY